MFKLFNGLGEMFNGGGSENFCFFSLSDQINGLNALRHKEQGPPPVEPKFQFFIDKQVYTR